MERRDVFSGLVPRKIRRFGFTGWIGAATKIKGTIVQLTDGTSFAVKDTCDEAVKKVAEASRLS
ncbi:MAG: hypothetical protein ACRD4S_16845 [Candidatus Acidiferrales bacterium]